jgi:hypothetical protein
MKLSPLLSKHPLIIYSYLKTNPLIGSTINFDPKVSCSPESSLRVFHLGF